MKFHSGYSSRSTSTGIDSSMVNSGDSSTPRHEHLCLKHRTRQLPPSFHSDFICRTHKPNSTLNSVPVNADPFPNAYAFYRAFCDGKERDHVCLPVSRGVCRGPRVSEPLHGEGSHHDSPCSSIADLPRSHVRSPEQNAVSLPQADRP